MSGQAVAISPRLDSVHPGIGIVAPFDLALDRELWRWTPGHVSLYLTRTPHMDEPVSVDMAAALGDLTEIGRACKAVSVPRPGATVYLCTSASFINGLAGEARLRDAMERAGARRALTTSGALLEALQALAVGRLAVGTPYDADLTARLADFLAEAGYETVGTSRMDLGADIWRVSAGSVRELVHAVPRAGAEAIFLSCTNLPTYEVIGELEREVGVPVLSANLVSMWAALRAIDALPGDRPERLFRDAR